MIVSYGGVSSVKNSDGSQHTKLARIAGDLDVLEQMTQSHIIPMNCHPSVSVNVLYGIQVGRAVSTRAISTIALKAFAGQDKNWPAGHLH